MATNFYFDQLYNTDEQRLLEDLIIESIQIHGHDTFYVSRTLRNRDKIYVADDSSAYNKAWMIEMYIKSVRGFSGDRDFLSALGAEIRDEVVFSVSQRRFQDEIGREADFIRPREGDLVYFPMGGKTFMIKEVDQREMFYQLGKLYTYELTCELFEYSGESFNTGIAEIDSISSNSTNALDWALLDDSGNRLLTDAGEYIVLDEYDLEAIDPAAQNDDIEYEGENVIDWTDKDPFSEGLL